jgi:hypothetical protein
MNKHCAQYSEEDILHYQAGEGRAAWREKFEAHLVECDLCWEALRGFDIVIYSLQATYGEELKSPKPLHEACTTPEAEQRYRAYLAGRLSSNEEEAVREHLLHCAACREKVATLLRRPWPVRLADRWRGRQARRPVEQRLAEKIVFMPQRWAYVPAVAVVLLAVGLVCWKSFRPTGPVNPYRAAPDVGAPSRDLTLEEMQMRRQMAQTLEDPREEAYWLFRIGQFHAQKGDPARAREHYQKALAMAERAGDEDLAARCRKALEGLEGTAL